jgi:hypothetical protein
VDEKRLSKTTLSYKPEGHTKEQEEAKQDGKINLTEDFRRSEGITVEE